MNPESPDPKSQRPAPPRWHIFAGVAASAVLLAAYARGAWPLGFVALVPWLLALRGTRTGLGTLACGWLMSLAFIAAVFPWFAAAVGQYTGLGTTPALLVLLALAPLLQPQWLAFALAQCLASRRHGPALTALAAGCAWIGCEWAFPKLLGDTLGHGLALAVWMRQAADLGGAALLTLALLLVNAALAHAILQWRAGWRRWLPPLALASALPALLAGYGYWRLAALDEHLAAPAPELRIGMIQSGIVDYERRRQEVGAYAVVRQVLDTHFGLSRAAIEHHGVDALLWSETVYPTPFGHPRSEDGAALDREILDFVADAGVPLVFGTYDVDDAGEYNAAAFVEPQDGLRGYYRKTHPFPLTEHVPAWMEQLGLRGRLPWAGSWLPGNGARVFTLRTADGRELNVLPLICLDDVRPQLAIDGARLGAQAIVGMSNDAWFTTQPIGARLHLAVAAFRSIETRMPQLRVTTNGLTAFVDPAGEVLVSTAMGDQAVLAGAVPAREAPATLMVAWGDWVGRAALALLALLILAGLLRAIRARVPRPADAAAAIDLATWSADLVLLTPAWRVATGLLRLVAAGGLGWLALGMLREGLQVNSLGQIRVYLAAVILPLVLAWAIQRAFAAQARIESGHLVLRQRGQRVEVPLASIQALRAWRLPLPGPGVDLLLASGRRLAQRLRIADPQSLARALAAAGSPASIDDASARRAAAAAARAAAHRPRLDHALVKFALFPLVPALPAFRLHQYIAFGGTFGEWQTFGAQAWLVALAIWWAAWSIGLMLYAAALRILAECAVALAAWRAPARAAAARDQIEWLARLASYVGAPAWLALRLLAN